MFSCLSTSLGLIYSLRNSISLWDDFSTSSSPCFSQWLSIFDANHMHSPTNRSATALKLSCVISPTGISGPSCNLLLLSVSLKLATILHNLDFVSLRKSSRLPTNFLISLTLPSDSDLRNSNYSTRLITISYEPPYSFSSWDTILSSPSDMFSSIICYLI